MSFEILEAEKSYYKDNIQRYDEVCQKLNERALTYGDSSQRIAYMPDDKRAILCHNVLNSLTHNDIALTSQYKDIIEYIVGNPNIGIIREPSVYYNEKTHSVKPDKINIENFKLAFFPFGQPKQHDFVETFDSHKNFTVLLYSFLIVNKDVFVRYIQVEKNHNNYEKAK
jgi:hypothetical protein